MVNYTGNPSSRPPGEQTRTPAAPAVRAEDLHVVRGPRTVLRDLAFTVPRGRITGLLGPSGCGKSTLIKAVAGLRPATQGTVRYDGRDLYADYAELRYRIGMVPQDDVLHTHTRTHTHMHGYDLQEVSHITCVPFVPFVPFILLIK